MTACILSSYSLHLMMKRLWIGLWLAIALPCCAQEWTASDSLRLQRWLEQEGEIQLNPLPERDVPGGYPLLDAGKPWLDFDTSLPRIKQDSTPKVRLTLHPYTATTRYDYDPVFQRKIKVDEHTWRGHTLASFQFKLMQGVARESASSPSGIDLMTLFTKDFWHFRARRASARTLQVLKEYGQ